jgi:hypothetical protein
MMKMMKKTIIFLILFAFFLPGFSLLADEGSNVQLPETVEGAKEMVGKALKTGQEEMPKNMKKVWEEEVLPVWSKMYDWFKVNILPKAENELKKREPGIKEDFRKKTGETKEEIKKEMPKISEDIRTLWKQFKNLINK